jgi:hypothetical protein
MTYANVELLNGVDVELADRKQIGEDEIRRITISCLVDTGAVMLTINEEIRQALGLRIKNHRPSQMADGPVLFYPLPGR